MLVTILCSTYTGYVSLAWPDRFFPFFFVVAEKSRYKGKGKKRSGHEILGSQEPIIRLASCAASYIMTLQLGIAIAIIAIDIDFMRVCS